MTMLLDKSPGKTTEEDSGPHRRKKSRGPELAGGPLLQSRGSTGSGHLMSVSSCTFADWCPFYCSRKCAIIVTPLPHWRVFGTLNWLILDGRTEFPSTEIMPCLAPFALEDERRCRCSLPVQISSQSSLKPARNLRPANRNPRQNPHPGRSGNCFFLNRGAWRCSYRSIIQLCARIAPSGRAGLPSCGIRPSGRAAGRRLV